MRAPWSKLARLRNPSDTATSSAKPQSALKIAAVLLRAMFICLLIILTSRVSMPQNETILTAYDTPNDLVRLVLGFAVCVWLVTQLFRVPSDVAGYRTWFYLGLAAVPFTLICLIAVW